MVSPSEIFCRENQYQFWGIDLQSYLLLRYGLKQVIRIGLYEDMFKEFRKTQQLKDFYIFSRKFNPIFYGQKFKEPMFHVYLSLKIELAKNAYIAEKEKDDEALGKLLGYPSCCVKNYIIKNSIKNKIPDFTIDALISTKTKPSFYCNSIFTFDSKLTSFEKSISYRRNDQVFSNSHHLFLIKHMPCSFDCRESIKIGKRILEILKKEMPELAKEIEEALKRPVLYFDYLNWLVFDGSVRRNQLKYKQILPYHSLFPKENTNLIKNGNRLITDDRQISIFSNKKIIGKIKKENKYRGVLIDFK